MNELSRRHFLKVSGLTAAALAAGPRLLLRLSRADGGPLPNTPVLVHVFQRGGMDGLNAVIPHADREYAKLRPGIGIRPPAKGREDAALDLDGRFGLHPALADLKAEFDLGRLAIVHAVGSPDPTRSHFDAQDYMETGTPGRKGTEDGWISRYVQANTRTGDETFRAIATTNTLPRCMKGDAKSLAIANFSSFDVGGGNVMSDALAGMYAEGEGPVKESGREAFAAVKRLRSINPGRFAPENGARYPRGGLGQQMLSIAQLIKADVGLEIAFAQSGGWDTHLNQGGATGGFANRLRELGSALHAFATDLGDRMENVVVVTLTEFGRTAKQNGTNGTDHGHGSASFVLGGPVNGGKVYGKWPGLATAKLWQKRDLAITTDFRDVLAEMLGGHLKGEGLDGVFPDHRPRKVGLL
jgi:uncharacterized protein (DUF1501 family)